MVIILMKLMFRYRWLVYINPNYYGLSSVAFFVLSEFDTDCTGDHLECYITSGPYILRQFFFDKINPYLHLVVSYFCKYYPIDQLIIFIINVQILLGFTMFYLLVAILANWLRHTTMSFNTIRSVFER